MKTETVAQEKRRVRRTRVLKGAKIVFHNHSSTINCTVRNLTNTGACLLVPHTAGIPPQFHLSFGDGSKTRVCRVTWRRYDRMGIAFESDADSALRAR